MANTNSIQKVEKFLQEKGKPATISEVIFGVNLTQKAVLEIVEILYRFGKINKMTNDKVTLIQLKQESDNATTQP